MNVDSILQEIGAMKTKMFPNAKIEEGCLLICPIHCDKNEKCGAGRCVDCRKKYWLSEID